MFPHAVAELDPGALAHNLAYLSRRAGVPLLLPVKAGAYGHGLEPIARLAAAAPEVWGVAAATSEEAMTLAALGLGKPVLLFGASLPGEWGLLAEAGVRLSVHTLTQARSLPPGALAHLEVDTGMHRLGVSVAEAHDAARELLQRGQLEGIYSHFYAPDDPDPARSLRQFELFTEVAAGFPGVIRHMGSSVALLRGLLDHLPGAVGLARPGLASYGLMPPAFHDPQLRPVMRLSACIVHLHTVPAGETVSYGGLWQAQRDTVVATVGLGYGDGYPRDPGLGAGAVVGGERRPILGRVCMDQLMVDVTGLDVEPGDWVTLWDDQMTLSEVAMRAGTTEAEVLTRLGSRIERRVREG